MKMEMVWWLPHRVRCARRACRLMLLIWGRLRRRLRFSVNQIWPMRRERTQVRQQRILCKHVELERSWRCFRAINNNHSWARTLSKPRSRRLWPRRSQESMRIKWLYKNKPLQMLKDSSEVFHRRVLKIMITVETSSNGRLV